MSKYISIPAFKFGVQHAEPYHEMQQRANRSTYEPIVKLGESQL
jgi:hypothetical protein